MPTTQHPTPPYPRLHADGADGRARAQALAEAARGEAEPAAVFSYRSAGRVAVIGDGQAAVDAAADLSARGLHCVLVTGDPAVVDGVQLLQARAAGLSGYLGNFELSLVGADGTGADGDGQVPLQTLLGPDWNRVDLVLDLGAEPLLAAEVSPPGYARPSPEGNPSDAIDALAELVGEFDKPRFFELDPSRCAHSRSGITACTRCLDACPTDAIRSNGDAIEVDPGLCQGAGVCASACPSGAINYAYPRRRDTLDALGRLLAAYAAAGGQAPVVLLHDAERGRELLDRIAAELPERVLPVELAEVGSAGLDAWLSIAARGGAVVALLPTGLPGSVRELLNEQLAQARHIVDGLGYDESIVDLIEEDALVADPAQLGALPTPDLPPARHAALEDKRGALWMALDHLHEHAARRPPMLNLEVGAAFGEVTVDKDRCTLCMACVSQCPANALAAGGDSPALLFTEGNCVQCSMCSRSCPENAIEPSPRLLFDAEKRRAQRVLKQEEPFCCVVCGKPFATRSMIERIKAQVGNHPMFAGDGLRRLEMCEDCRVIDMHRAETDGAGYKELQS